ncbi:MAG: signal recognition particle subunit SRP19/SEC65 family protein [Candidatus Hodarchaeales archaeon]|jgi:signal recognition particle subunit SRP19
MRRESTHYIIFPEYLDKSLTRKEGRRLPLSSALDNPSLAELRLAADKLKYKFELRKDAAYPRQWWQRNGIILVEKRKSKINTLHELSSAIKAIRPALEKQKRELTQEAKKRKLARKKRPKKTEREKKKKKSQPKRRR